MGRVVAVFLLSFSLMGFAQTNTPQTSTIPAHVNLDPAPPLVYGTSTPMNILTQPAPNDSSVSVGDFRVATPLVPSGPPPSVVVPDTGATTESAAAAAQNAEPQGGSFSFGVAVIPANSTSGSVADAASQYRVNKATMKSRVIDNNTLGTIDRNPSGLVTTNELTMPQSDISPEEEAALRHAKPQYAAAGDTLDPRDLAAVEAAVRRSQNAETAAEPRKDEQASAQYEQMSREGEAQIAQNTEPQIAAPPASRVESDQEQSQATPETGRERLPESSSSLPFIALLGALSLGGGLVSVLRSRA